MTIILGIIIFVSGFVAGYAAAILTALFLFSDIWSKTEEKRVDIEEEISN